MVAQHLRQCKPVNHLDCATPFFGPVKSIAGLHYKQTEKCISFSFIIKQQYLSFTIANVNQYFTTPYH
jgi:hypothetical protein